MNITPSPIAIKLLQKSRILEITFEDGKHFALPCSYLRKHSPSAEMKIANRDPIKEETNIIGIEPVGNYAIKLIFDDGHDTGLYSWETLYKLGNQFNSTQ
jgi:DUF971 family protein